MNKYPQADPSCPNCAALSARIDSLEALVKSLGEEVARLRSRKPKTSRTSSKPPSSDTPWDKAEDSKPSPSEKKQGGQSGHKGKNRPPASLEDISETHMVKPTSCGSCSAPLMGNDPSPRLHHVIDIPRVSPKIIEYQLHQLECPECGKSTRAGLPTGV
ncbi:MAG: hypothetical protein GY930_04295, partial [bacterium]|nr:hypothetical protein [bacterium]